MNIEIKRLQLEIFEAERLIERNKIILTMHMQRQEELKEMEALRQAKEQVYDN